MNDARRRIGYYVHHHGRGHATRAGVIGAALTRRGHRVTYLGSGALPAGEQVVLTRDDDGESFADPEAGGRLHWAPLGGGYAQRAQEIATWIAEAQPDVVVVDVSVEVTVLVRLLGVPVVTVAQPGRRDDAPHALGYELATVVLAPWPDGLDVAPHLGGYGEKFACVGGITRFARDGGAVPQTEAQNRDGHLTGVVLTGGEGWDRPPLVEDLCAATPEVRWMTPSPEKPLDELLAQADVVMTHAGQNALADVAAFDVPALVLAQHRPFGEQADMASALDRAGIAVGCAPDAELAEVLPRLRELLQDLPDRRARHRWQAWGVDGAAARACGVIERVGGGRR